MLALTHLTGFNARRSGALHKRGRGTAGFSLATAGVGARHVVGVGAAPITVGASGVGTLPTVHHGAGTATIDFAASATGTLTASLIGVWPLDSLSGGDFLDSFGSYDITPGTGVTVGTGKISGDAEMDLDAADGYKLQFSSSSPTTGSIAFWIRANSSGNSSSDYSVLLRNIGVGIPFGANVGDESLSLEAGNAVFSGDSDTWYFVVFEWDADTVYLWVNGTAQADSESAPADYDQAWVFDTIQLNGPLGVVCQIDELSFWGHKLTQAQIDYLYNSGSGQAYPYTLP